MTLSLSQGFCAPLLLMLSAAHAGTITYTGAGGDLPDATFNTGSVVNGVFESDLLVSCNHPLPGAGVSVTLTLLGFYHPFAGDLVVELINVPNGVTATVFSRVGKTTNTPYPANPGDPDDPGSLADFSPGTSNYVFRDDATNDLWATALGLGDVDAIPTDEYFSSIALTGAPGNLSFAFNGLDPNGVWRLRVIDYYPDNPTDAPPVFRGSLQAWQLTLANVPEPGTAALMAAAVAAGWIRSRKA